jgi:hypothetical protein
MSNTKDGRGVFCDGPGPHGDGCDACARLPVGLQRRLGGGTDEAGQAAGIDGWLFVKGGATERHFCPTCVPSYLRGIGLAPYHSLGGKVF